MPEFVRDAAEIPRVEFRQRHLDARVVVLGENHRLVFRREQQRVEHVAVRRVAKPVALVAPGGPVVRRIEYEAPVRLAAAEPVEDEHMLALGIDRACERLAHLGPRLVAGGVLVVSRRVLAAHHVDDELSGLALQRKPAAFHREALLQSVAKKAADVGHDPVQPRGIVRQRVAVSRMEIDEPHDGAGRLFTGVKGGDALLR